MPIKNKSEQIAETILSKVFQSYDIEYFNQQSNCEPDFQIRSRDSEKIIPVEVTQVTDEHTAETLNAIGKLESIPASKTQSSWLLVPFNHTSIKELSDKADKLLSEMDSYIGDQKFFHQSDPSIRIRSLCAELGIEYGMKVPAPNEKPSIEIAIPSNGKCAQISGNSVTNLATNEAFKSDNRKKLNRYHNSRRRHLFVLVTWDESGGWFSINTCNPPNFSPDLPQKSQIFG